MDRASSPTARLPAQGEAADGLKTTLHYADDLDNPADKAFRAAFMQKRYGAEPDVYAVQGYDAAALLDARAWTRPRATSTRRIALYAAMRAAKINSPRGPMTISAANNPIQNIYLREVKNGKNVYVKIAAEALCRSRHWLQDGVTGWPASYLLREPCAVMAALSRP